MRFRADILTDTLVVGLSAAFLAGYFPLELVLDPSTPTGGDIPAHNYLAGYLRDTLLPRGQVSGWAPGWWAGFPLFRFYMVPPYLLMAVLGYVMPLEVAFKLVCALTVILLPPAAYFGLKWAGARRPAPAFGAAFMIPFLFVKTHTTWGMNLYSLLAGEIANALGLCFVLLYWGLFLRGVREERDSLWCPVLLALTILTHPTTGLLALFSSLWALVYLRRKNARRWLGTCVRTFGLSFLLVAFWTLPLLFTWEYTVGFGNDWPVSLPGSFPGYALIFVAGAVAGLLYGLFKRRGTTGYMAFSLLVSLVLYEFGTLFNLVNIRFWAFIYLFLILLAAEGFALLSRRIPGGFLLPVIPLIVSCYAFSPERTVADEWAYWNFTGFESKPGWGTYRKILEAVDGTRGRLAHDLHDANNGYFGSVRVFEAVPYFVDKAIIEGGIIQSGLSSLFTMHLQGEFSPTTAGIPRIVKAGPYDLEQATRHLELFNVKHLVARHEQLRTDLDRSEAWRRLGDPGPHHALYELTTHEGKMVFIPEHHPIPVAATNWKRTALDWFYDARNMRYPLVFLKDRAERGPFGMAVQDPETVQAFLFRERGGRPGYILNWLVLGPFPNPLDTSMDFWDPASTDPFGRDEDWIAGARPRAGDRTLGRKWETLIKSDEYIDLKQHYPARGPALACACATILSPRALDATLHYGSDDGIKIWLNGEPLVENRGHRSWRRDQFSVAARLKKGENVLILKCENAGGSWGFSVRVTDRDGNPLSGLAFRPGPDRDSVEALKPAPTGVAGDDLITGEDVGGREIRFHTEGVGLPHIVKVSYFPNWHVEGAERVYLVSPAFLLVYPDRKEVRLFYGPNPIDRIGNALTLCGVLLLCLHVVGAMRKKREVGR